MTKTLVVARWQENLDWLSDVAGWTVVVIDKGRGEIPNDSGREATSYLHYICTNYDRLDGFVAFCQGDPFPHCEGFLGAISNDEEHIYGRTEACSPNGQPRCECAQLHEYSQVLGLPKFDKYEFIAGAQFRVHADQIRDRSLEFWWQVVELCRSDPFAGWTCERLWPQFLQIRLPVASE